MKVCTTTAEPYNNDLAKKINLIGYENILQVLPCYHGMGSYSFTIVYKDAEESVKAMKGSV